jgi:hypothetical protein
VSAATGDFRTTVVMAILIVASVAIRFSQELKSSLATADLARIVCSLSIQQLSGSLTFH